MPLTHDGHVQRSPLSMLKNLAVWTSNKLSRYRSWASRVLEASDRLTDKSDDELRALFATHREEALNGKPLDDLLVPVFALVREAATRTIGLRHYPVQILGGIALHKGHIVEMATGEGKTLVSTCPAALNALTDRGVHIVTVNDYLAKRDSEEMGQVHRFLGLTVGLIVHDSTPQDRVLAYRRSITYGTNKEFGFDYLRDEIRNRNPSWYEPGRKAGDLKIQRVQRPIFHFAIVDEADSVLIDEARTPLIIADAPPVDEETAFEFHVADQAVSLFAEEEDFTWDRKEKRIEWTRGGEQKVTRELGGRRNPAGHRVDWHEAVLRAIKSHVLYRRDIEYVVEDDEVIIVDENTGRKMPGRHWEEGLHQAVSAKERVTLKGQNEALARTTYQVFFNRYEKLSGMTGTAVTDSVEFATVYHIGCLKIPTNKPVRREVLPDVIHATEMEKWRAVMEETKAAVERGRAVLVGTRSIDKSEILSRLLHEAGVPHVILNARHEAKEAAIVAEAGRKGRVTVATNMAGRGTDIKLDPEVTAAGGLYVIGTERHESRRVDNQLAGRSARQGDPGSVRFFLSAEDPLIARYRPAVSKRLAARYGGRNEPIPGNGIRRFFRNVQLSIERQHRKLRRELIKFDRERSRYNRQLGTE
jgi:preprotein translocase subunit SecA